MCNIKGGEYEFVLVLKFCNFNKTSLEIKYDTKYRGLVLLPVPGKTLPSRAGLPKEWSVNHLNQLPEHLLKGKSLAQTSVKKASPHPSRIWPGGTASGCKKNLQRHETDKNKQKTPRGLSKDREDRGKQSSFGSGFCALPFYLPYNFN